MNESCPTESAIDRWYALHPNGRDRPNVTLWMPSEPPFARLQTVGHGCGELDTLPDGPPIAHLTLGGVDIGGYLDELELLLAAAVEVLAHVREQHDEMRARQERP